MAKTLQPIISVDELKHCSNFSGLFLTNRFQLWEDTSIDVSKSVEKTGSYHFELFVCWNIVASSLEPKLFEFANH